MPNRKRDEAMTEILHNFHAIKRAHSYGSRISNQQFGMTFTQIPVLMMLLHEGRKTMTEIAQLLGVSRGAATQLLDKPISQGFLRRYNDAKDRRVIYIELTNEGRERLRCFHHGGIAQMRNLFEILNDEELDYVVSITARLAERAKETKE